MSKLGGLLALFGKSTKIGAFTYLWENRPFVRNAAILEVRGIISPTINIVLSERVTEISAVVRTQ